MHYRKTTNLCLKKKKNDPLSLYAHARRERKTEKVNEARAYNVSKRHLLLPPRTGYLLPIELCRRRRRRRTCVEGGRERQVRVSAMLSRLLETSGPLISLIALTSVARARSCACRAPPIRALNASAPLCSSARYVCASARVDVYIRARMGMCVYTDY